MPFELSTAAERREWLTVTVSAALWHCSCYILALVLGASVPVFGPPEFAGDGEGGERRMMRRAPLAPAATVDEGGEPWHAANTAVAILRPWSGRVIRVGTLAVQQAYRHASREQGTCVCPRAASLIRDASLKGTCCVMHETLSFAHLKTAHPKDPTGAIP